MSKHQIVAIGGGDLLNMIAEQHGGEHFTEALGLHCDCDCVCTCNHKVKGDWWVVSWPDHVSFARYNSDAIYRGPMSEQEARELTRAKAGAVFGE